MIRLFSRISASVSLWVSEHYNRAGPGGTGAAKCGGNYASSLIAQREATIKQPLRDLERSLALMTDNPRRLFEEAR